LPRVVHSNFGNYVLQKSLNVYGKSDHQKIKLLKAIIQCLTEVPEYKVQQKWGNELLKSFIHELSENQHQKQELLALLNEKMEKINLKFKQQKLT
jgi:hypothetical protein